MSPGSDVILGPANMNPALRLTYYTTLPLSFILQLAITVFMLRRKQVRTFPVFFAYTIFHLVQAVLSFIAYHISYTVLFYEWWTGEMLDIFFTFAVIQEIFVVTFQPYDSLRRWGIRLYGTGILVLSTASVFMGIRHPGGYTPRVSALFTLDRSGTFVQVGLLLFLFIFCRLFGMTWRHYVFGIASGFVVMAGIMTTGEAVRTHFGVLADPWLTLSNAMAFTLGVVVWTYYFASAKSRVPLDRVPGTEKLIAWNRVLGEIAKRPQSDL